MIFLFKMKYEDKFFRIVLPEINFCQKGTKTQRFTGNLLKNKALCDPSCLCDFVAFKTNIRC
jgi:hypothetical protein